MRQVILAAIVASTILGQIASHAQVMITAVPQPTEEQRVLAAEDEYVAAEVARDGAALRRLVDDRFAFNSSKGTVTGKEDFIQGVLKLTMVGQTIRERSVLIDGDIALVFGTAELRFADPGKGESVQNLRYTSTYVKRQGQWRMLALQMQQRAPKSRRARKARSLMPPEMAAAAAIPTGSGGTCSSWMQEGCRVGRPPGALA